MHFFLDGVWNLTEDVWDVVDHTQAPLCHCNLTARLLIGVQLVWAFVVRVIVYRIQSF